jgi:hypothetical protein
MLQLLGGSGLYSHAMLYALGWIDDLPIFHFRIYIRNLAEVLATSVVVGYRAMQMRREQR